MNSEQVDVIRDLGPQVTFNSPVADERYSGSVNLSFLVTDPHGVEAASVTAQVTRPYLAEVLAARRYC